MRRLVLLALFAVAACGERSPPQSGDKVAAAKAVEVAAVDQFGPAGGRISGLALWTHPTLPFNGLVVAAGDKGVVAYNVEDGAEVYRDDVAVEGLSATYLGRGDAAIGYLAARMPGSERKFRVYAVDNAARSLTLLETLFISARTNASSFCFGRTRDGALVLHEVGPDGWRSTPLQITQTIVSAVEGSSGSVAGGLEHCVADDLDGAVFAISPAGDVFRLADGAAALLAATGVRNPVAIGLALNGLVEGGATSECCGQIAVLDGDAGIVRLFDREDGRAIGAVRLKSSFDVDAVETATAMAFGNGNFGGVYRDGLLALATDAADSEIRLTPLNGVMDALATPLGPTANPRDLSPQADVGIVIDIDLVNP